MTRKKANLEKRIARVLESRYGRVFKSSLGDGSNIAYAAAFFDLLPSLEYYREGTKRELKAKWAEFKENLPQIKIDLEEKLKERQEKVELIIKSITDWMPSDEIRYHSAGKLCRWIVLEKNGYSFFIQLYEGKITYNMLKTRFGICEYFGHIVDGKLVYNN